MKIKLSEIQDVFESLRELLTKTLDFKTAYRLKRLADEVDSVANQTSKDHFNTVKKYGALKKDKDGKEIQGQYQVTPENSEAFKKEWDEYMDREIELKYEPIKLSLIQNSPISAFALSRLQRFFVDDIKVSEGSEGKV